MIHQIPSTGNERNTNTGNQYLGFSTTYLHHRSKENEYAFCSGDGLAGDEYELKVKAKHTLNIPLLPNIEQGRLTTSTLYNKKTCILEKRERK